MDVGIQFEYVQFQCIGAGLFEVFCKFNPSIRPVAIDAGDDGYRAERLRLADEVEIVLYLVRLHVATDIIGGFRITRLLEHRIALHFDLLFEQGFEDDGTRSGLFELFVALGVHRKSRTAHDNRGLGCQSRVLGL